MNWYQTITNIPNFVSDIYNLNVENKHFSELDTRISELIKNINTDYFKSINDLSEFLKKNRNELTDYDIAWLNFHLAYCYYNIDDFFNSINHYNKCIKFNNNIRDYYFERAAAKRNYRDFEGAIIDLKKSFQKRPVVKSYTEAMIYKELGTVYQEKKEYDKAIQHFKKSMQLDSSLAWNYIEISSTILKKSGQYNVFNEAELIKALEHISIGLDKIESGFINNPKYRLDYNKALIYQIEAGIYEKLNNRFKTLSSYMKSLKLYNNHTTYYLLSDFFSDNINYSEIEKAIVCSKMANTITEESNEKYLFQLGILLKKWKKYKGDFDLKFYQSLGVKSQFYNQTINIDNFRNRNDLANTLFSRSFISFFSNLSTFKKYLLNTKSKFYSIQTGTELDDFPNQIEVSFYMGNSNKKVQSIINEEFYFTAPSQFQEYDPDDSLGVNQTIPSNLVEFSDKNIRLRSLSSNTTRIKEKGLMLEKYCTKHNGFIFILTIKKEWLLLNKLYANKVKYYKTYQEPISNDAETHLKHSVFYKSESYTDEEEFRIAKFGKYNDNEGEYISWNKNILGGVQIKKIYIALKTPKADIKKLLNGLSNIKNIEIIKIAKKSKGNYIYEKIDIDEYL